MPNADPRSKLLRDFVKCKTHGLKQDPRCLSCHMAVDWNCWRQFCECGTPAVGLVFHPEHDPKFYCDEHFPEAADAKR